MSEETGYNGWTNYETWCVNLWMGNDGGSSAYWGDRAKDFWIRLEDYDGQFTREEKAALDLTDCLQEEFSESMPDLGCTVWADLLGASLSEVNWYEIARGLIDGFVKLGAEDLAK